MKRIVFALTAILLTAGMLQAGWFGRRGGCCNNNRVYAESCAPTCAPACAPACEPAAPRCCKTIQVPQTIMVNKIVEVPARKIVIPQPDIVEYVEQPCIEVRTPQPPLVIPQPDIITYKQQPCRVVRHPQAPCIRWECPRGCDNM